MRKVILFMMTTLNGYYEGPYQTIDWHNVDEEFNDFAEAQLDSVDTLLFGRVTYEMMASFWPTPFAIVNDPIIAEKMNSTSKVVFSNSLERADWNNTSLLKGDAITQLASLKQKPGKDMLLLASSDLAVTFAQQNLIDEYRVMVNPVLLGDGKALLKGLPSSLRLKRDKVRTFNSGNVLLCYSPQRA